MAITKWTPWHELEAMEQRVRRLVETQLLGPLMLPSTDVYETETEWVAELEVPGFQEKDLDVEVVGDTLRVSGKREESTDEEKNAFHRKERLETAFERRFTLPAGANVEAVTATHDNGVLRVQVPTTNDATDQPRKITIGKQQA